MIVNNDTIIALVCNDKDSFNYIKRFWGNKECVKNVIKDVVNIYIINHKNIIDVSDFKKYYDNNIVYIIDRVYDILHPLMNSEG